GRAAVQCQMAAAPIRPRGKSTPSESLSFVSGPPKMKPLETAFAGGCPHAVFAPEKEGSDSSKALNTSPLQRKAGVFLTSHSVTLRLQNDIPCSLRPPGR